MDKRGAIKTATKKSTGFSSALQYLAKRNLQEAQASRIRSQPVYKFNADPFKAILISKKEWERHGPSGE